MIIPIKHINKLKYREGMWLVQGDKLISSRAEILIYIYIVKI